MPQDPLFFLQRTGQEPLPAPMKPNQLSDDLRREIYDAICEFLQSLSHFPDGFRSLHVEAKQIIQHVLGEFLKKPKDEIDLSYDEVRSTIKKIVLERKAGEVYEFLEILINRFFYFMKVAYFIEDSIKFLVFKITKLFDKHSAPYLLYFLDGFFHFIRRGNEAEGLAIKRNLEIIREGGSKNAEKCLLNASKHIDDGKFADSVRESINAVEIIARKINPSGNTLGKALSSLEKGGVVIHPALKEGFIKLYGYTKDEQGISHPLIDKDSHDVSLDEALFMFGACASFTAYLVTKSQNLPQESSPKPKNA